MENIINSLLIKCLRDSNYSLYISLIDDNYEYTKHKYVFTYNYNDNLIPLLTVIESIRLNNNEDIYYEYIINNTEIRSDKPLINRDLVDIVTKFYTQCQ